MKRKISATAKAIAGVLIVAAIGGALQKCWPAVSKLGASCDSRWLWAAGAAALLYRVLNAAGWGLVLRALGHPLPVLTGIRLWLVAETMRWLPGSIWGYCSRVHQAQRAGIPPAAAALSMPLELVVTIVAWVLAAGAGGVKLGQMAAPLIPQWPAAKIWALVAALLAAAACGGAFIVRHPENRFVKKARGLLRDLASIVRARPRVQPLAASLAWFTLLCFFNGLAFYAVLRALTPHPPAAGVVIGINALGWLAGFFAIFSPGGLGVREGGMTALLLPFVPLEIALGSVVLWRIVQIAAEVICLGGCYLPCAADFLFRRTSSTSIVIDPAARVQ